jgi:hypothetical protein
MNPTLTADSAALNGLATRSKCYRCRKRFDRPPVLPVQHPVPGRFRPRFNPEWVHHMHDTHGIPPETWVVSLLSTVYGEWPWYDVAVDLARESRS